MTFKDFMRGFGLWLSKTLLVMLLIGFVAAIAISNLTSEDFLKPLIGQTMAAQAAGVPGGQEQVDSMFSELYKKKVCSGYSCLGVVKNLQNPADIVTRDFNIFITSQIWILGVLAAVFVLFVVLLAKGLPRKFTAVGGSFISAGAPYFIIKVVGKNLGSFVPAEMASAIPFIVDILKPIANIFLVILIVGVVCSVTGWGMRIYRKRQEKKGKTGKK